MKELGEVMIKTILKKKKCKKVKYLSEEPLQIAEKKREVKAKGTRERHTHIYALVYCIGVYLSGLERW